MVARAGAAMLVAWEAGAAIRVAWEAWGAWGAAMRVAVPGKLAYRSR
jgi:hypothetical protein